jgi:hypothetical protein
VLDRLYEVAHILRLGEVPMKCLRRSAADRAQDLAVDILNGEYDDVRVFYTENGFGHWKLCLVQENAHLCPYDRMLTQPADSAKVK